MQAGDHLISNLSLAIVTENLIPIAGAPIHWPDLIPAPGIALTTAMIAKGGYYACIIAAASLPDFDQRLRLFPHRTFTHSLIGIVCLLSALLGLRTLLFMVLTVQHLTVSPEEQLLGQMVVIALPLACAFHVLGDLVTRRGVALFWPKAIYVRLVPKRWAIKNQHWSEYLVVAFLFGTVALGIALNICGL